MSLPTFLFHKNPPGAFFPMAGRHASANNATEQIRKKALMGLVRNVVASPRAMIMAGEIVFQHRAEHKSEKERSRLAFELQKKISTDSEDR
jgi:hypothetical protein